MPSNTVIPLFRNRVGIIKSEVNVSSSLTTSFFFFFFQCALFLTVIEVTFCVNFKKKKTTKIRIVLIKIIEKND